MCHVAKPRRDVAGARAQIRWCDLGMHASLKVAQSKKRLSASEVKVVLVCMHGGVFAIALYTYSIALHCTALAISPPRHLVLIRSFTGSLHIARSQHSSASKRYATTLPSTTIQILLSTFRTESTVQYYNWYW